jgi:hypothetical protein
VELGEAEVDWLWIRPSRTTDVVLSLHTPPIRKLARGIHRRGGSGAAAARRIARFATVSETVQHGTGGPTAILTPWMDPGARALARRVTGDGRETRRLAGRGRFISSPIPCCSIVGRRTGARPDSTNLLIHTLLERNGHQIS